MALSRWARRRIQAYLFAKGMLQRMTLGVRGMLIDGDRILMVRHTYVPGWQFPGGGVDPGESAPDAFRREVLEETGFRVTDQPELFGIYHNTRVTNRDHVAFFISRAFEKERAFTPGIEIAEIGWFDYRDLPAETADGSRERVAEILEGAPRSANW